MHPDSGAGRLKQEDTLSGVSITSGGDNVSTAAILAGGQEFMTRLAQFEEARVAADQAREALGIGKDVVALRDAAQRALDTANANAAEIEAQSLAKATKEQKTLNDFIAQCKDETMRQLQAAQSKAAEADRKLAAADEAQAAAGKIMSEAQETLAKANAARDAIAAAQQALGKL
jgi:hypothetical protein